MTPIEFLDIIDTINVAELLDEDTLSEIGTEVVEGYEEDEDSRSDWVERNEEWMKLATQVVEKKNFPWTGAANIKYPLVSTAAIQFAARAYPALVPGVEVVKGRVMGKDPDGEKTEKAIRIGKHMSFQLLEQMEEWEEDMDRLCINIPIVGCAFKKSYYDVNKQRNASELVYAKDLVVNYYARSLETAYRKTHLLEMSSNELYEREKSEEFLDVDLYKDNGETTKDNSISDEVQGLQEPGDSPNTPRLILEQHTFIDLDGDGYQEPYIVTVDFDTRKVLRIVKRFSHEVKGNVMVDGETIIKIVPDEYFTKFPFIPNPDGGFYDVGFGILLGPLNETVNTLINQLLDAGTLSNLPSGFLSRGIRLKGGNRRFSPGEWKVVDSTGDDLRKGLVPLPINQPSSVLFNLLGMIVNAGERLASVTDINVGENPGQNQKATTTMAVLEQGLKVFTAIYKRNHRALKKEYKKLFKLNSENLDPEEYFTILDPEAEQGATIAKEDYQSGNFDVIPASDPSIVTEQQKMMRAQALLELLPLGLNPDEVKKRVLEAQGQPNIDVLLQVPPPQTPPEIALKQAELQLEAQFRTKELELREQELEDKSGKSQAEAILALAKAESETVKSSVAELAQQLETIKTYIETVNVERERREQKSIPRVEAEPSND